MWDMTQSFVIHDSFVCETWLMHVSIDMWDMTYSHVRRDHQTKQGDEMVPEPRGVCFKLWMMKSSSCFRHSPRSHIVDILWNSEPDSRHQFSSCFWSAFFGFSENAFLNKRCWNDDTNHPPEGSTFWWDVYSCVRHSSACYSSARSIS